MDTVLIAPIIFVALIVGCAAVGAVSWSKGKVKQTALFAVLVIPLAIALVQWSLPPAVPPYQPYVETPSVQATLAALEKFRPREEPSHGYLTSAACQECHRDNHQSWQASYHRTMTQIATPEAVIGDFDHRQVTLRGRDYALRHEGDVCWVTMPDPDYPPSPETIIDVPIMMTTGSHHMQLYWYATNMAQTLAQLPIVYLKETNQWIPRTSSFLKPPHTPISSEMGRWNSGCSKCHSTHPRERNAGNVWYTQVSEFGISCEACHGPGEQHVALHRQSQKVTNDPIVNPANLSSQASSQVCGQCHSVHSNLESPSVVQNEGHGFRPGRDLNETHQIWQRDSEVMREFLQRMDFEEGDTQALRRVFWDDGMVRVSGREYNGLIESACFQQGELSCLSCHSMHQGPDDQRSLAEWADDQLSIAGMSDQACLQCHNADDFGENHHHHPQQSAGARCYNCHMPHTSYGLLKAIRSHTINSPDIARDLAARRPNACNLCHLDKTLSWSAEAMNKWYDKEIPEFTAEQTSVSAALRWLLQGDAGQRALAAWSMGWQDAQAASGTDWIAPLLAEGLNDPYDAVRFIARRSIRSLARFQDLEFDAISPATVRRQIVAQVRDTWHQAADRPKRVDEALLLGEQGLLLNKLQALQKDRDDTEIDLLE